LEQRVVEDLARWYGPVGSKRYRAVLAWLDELRKLLVDGCVGSDWGLCEQLPPKRLEGCWRVHFSQWDAPSVRGTIKIAAGGREDRVVAEVIMIGGEAGIRVLAIGPKYAGKGQGRQEWVYRHADQRRRHPYIDPKGGEGE